MDLTAHAEDRIAYHTDLYYIGLLIDMARCDHVLSQESEGLSQ